MISHSKIDQTLKILLKEQKITTMLDRLSKKYNPFKVLISTILSARAKDEVTEVISKNLFKEYPTAKKLASANKKDVIKIIRKIGFYNNKSKNIINASKMLLEKFNNQVPKTMNELIELPGVGRKVANCVLVYAYKQNVIPVDTHVHRISNRLGWVKTKSPEDTEKALESLVPKRHWQILNDTLVSHGKTICTPISPFCSKCPISAYCNKINIKKHR